MSAVFLLTYLHRELSRRRRQAMFTALGLAVGVGLVVTVSAASAGVARAETEVLGALYGVGTDVTVTGTLVKPLPAGAAAPAGVPQNLEMTPRGPEACTGGTCVSMGGKTLNYLTSPYSGFSASTVARAARLPDVTAAAGGVELLDSTVSFTPSGNGSQAGSTVVGVDTAHPPLGPLGSASLVSGRSFTPAEADSDVAVADSGYAQAHHLMVGKPVTISHVRYKVIGIVSPSRAGSPPGIYIPLARAQDLALASGSMAGKVNTIYLTAASAADIPAVSREVSAVLPGATVTTAGSLASQVTGSLASADKLADDLGRWLSVLVLAAAFTMACLLTLAATGRRAGEFGVLKAVGWRSRRIVGQVLAESAVIGIVGAVAGICLGFAGMAIIAGVAPGVTATVGSDSLPVPSSEAGADRDIIVSGTALVHDVPVPLHPSVSVGVIALAVLLALAGGLLAGAFGSWRVARMRPSDALARIT